MTYREIRGNLFNSPCAHLVNTVNCVGVMGKGIALAFKQRYPAMYAKYQSDCGLGYYKPGYVYQHGPVLNFAVKAEWRNPSKLTWVEACLLNFVAQYERWGITSVALPWLGAMNGQLPLFEVQALMRKHLSCLPITVEVYDFQP
jgi:O-acetyl-ADP-ribose deacetylase (regulator of RNase III)